MTTATPEMTQNESAFELTAADRCDSCGLDLQAQDDEGQPLPLRWDAAARQLQLSAAGAGRSTLSLSISGTPQFAQAFDAWPM